VLKISLAKRRRPFERFIMSLETLRISQKHAVVVYDSATGEVRHIHQVTVVQGAKAPTTHEIEARALALAKKLGRHDPSRLKVLHIAPENLKQMMRHKVDLESLKLVSETVSRKRKR
jgi:hypothetical protein